MMDLLHSFGAGIAFSVGVLVGAFLCRIAQKEGRKEFVEEIREHNRKVEDRLHLSMLAHTRMADALEKGAAKERSK